MRQSPMPDIGSDLGGRGGGGGMHTIKRYLFKQPTIHLCINTFTDNQVRAANITQVREMCKTRGAAIIGADAAEVILAPSVQNINCFHSVIDQQKL